MVLFSTILCDEQLAHWIVYAVVHHVPVVNLPSRRGLMLHVNLLWSESSLTM